MTFPLCSGPLKGTAYFIHSLERKSNPPLILNCLDGFTAIIILKLIVYEKPIRRLYRIMLHDIQFEYKHLARPW